MARFQRCFLAAVVLLFALPIIVAAQKDESPPVGKDLELKACGPKDNKIKYSVSGDKSQHATGTASAAEGLIYVVRSGGYGIQYKVAVDGEWKGVNTVNSYFFFTVRPGEHYFCSTDGHVRRTVVLTVEAGKTYYLEQKTQWLGPIAGYSQDLLPIDDEEGKQKVADEHLSTWTMK